MADATKDEVDAVLGAESALLATQAGGEISAPGASLVSADDAVFKLPAVATPAEVLAAKDEKLKEAMAVEGGEEATAAGDPSELVGEDVMREKAANLLEAVEEDVAAEAVGGVAAAVAKAEEAAADAKDDAAAPASAPRKRASSRSGGEESPRRGSGAVSADRKRARRGSGRSSGGEEAPATPSDAEEAAAAAGSSDADAAVESDDSEEAEEAPAKKRRGKPAPKKRPGRGTPAAKDAPYTATALGEDHVQNINSCIAELQKKTVAQLKAMLTKNEQKTVGAKAELIERVAECKVLGSVPKCELCGAHLRWDRETGEYTCPGKFSDGAMRRCSFKSKTLERLPWKP